MNNVTVSLTLVGVNPPPLLPRLTPTHYSKPKVKHVGSKKEPVRAVTLSKCSSSSFYSIFSNHTKPPVHVLFDFLHGYFFVQFSVCLTVFIILSHNRFFVCVCVCIFMIPQKPYVFCLLYIYCICVMIALW